HVRDAQDQVGRQLVLDFQAPILNHARAAIPSGQIVGTTSVEKRRILGIGGGREGRKTGIERLYARTKLVWRWKIRIHRGSAGKLVAKIRVAESGIINTV